MGYLHHEYQEFISFYSIDEKKKKQDVFVQ
jgi:hypothetical protein